MSTKHLHIALPLLLLLLVFLLYIPNFTATAQANSYPSATQYKEDYNGDGSVNIADVIALLLFQRDNPGDLGGDYDGDGTSDIADAMALIINIHHEALTPSEIYSLSGQVVESGKGVEGVDVRVKGPDGVVWVTTDSDGMYRIENLPNGTYAIWCKKAEYNYTFSSEELEIAISGNSVTVPEIEAILAAYTLSGKVLENSIGLPGVTLNVQGVGIDTTVVTDSEGLYTVDGLLDAHYSVLPVKENYSFTPISLSVSIWGESVTATDIIATPIGASPATLYTVSGRITCPVQAQINVQVLLTGDMEASTITDGNGFYSFAVPNGVYTIVGIPNPVFQMFNPTSYDITVDGQDILDLNFSAWGAGGTGE